MRIELYKVIKDIEKTYTKDYIPNLEELQLQSFLTAFFSFYKSDLNWDYEYDLNSLYFYIFIKYKEEVEFNRYCFTLSKIQPKRKSTCPVYYILYRLAKMEGFNLFYTPNVFYKIYNKETKKVEKQGALNDLVCLSNSFFIDIDKLDVDIKDFTFKDIDDYLHKKYDFIDLIYPNLIVKSGGGLHLYFLLDEADRIYKGNESTAQNRNKHTEIQKILIKMFKADEQCKDLKRILRVPFSSNYKEKYKEPRKIEIFFSDLYKNNDYKNIEQEEFFTDFINKDIATNFVYYTDYFYDELFTKKDIKDIAKIVFQERINNFKESKKKVKSAEWEKLRTDIDDSFSIRLEGSYEKYIREETSKKDTINNFLKCYETLQKEYKIKIYSRRKQDEFSNIFGNYFKKYFGYFPTEKNIEKELGVIEKKEVIRRKRTNITQSELEFYRKHGKQAVRNLVDNRLSDLELWFSLHKDNLEGYRHPFFLIYINLLKQKGIKNNEIRENCLELYNNKDCTENIEALINEKTIYKFKNTTIADYLHFSKEEIKMFKCIYTIEDKEKRIKENIKKQNKKRDDSNRLKKESKLETIKNILLENKDKKNAELMELLNVSESTIKRYKRKLKEENNNNIIQFKDIA